MGASHVVVMSNVLQLGTNVRIHIKSLKYLSFTMQIWDYDRLK